MEVLRGPQQVALLVSTTLFVRLVDHLGYPGRRNKVNGVVTTRLTIPSEFISILLDHMTVGLQPTTYPRLESLQLCALTILGQKSESLAITYVLSVRLCEGLASTSTMRKRNRLHH